MKYDKMAITDTHTVKFVSVVVFNVREVLGFTGNVQTGELLSSFSNLW